MKFAVTCCALLFSFLSFAQDSSSVIPMNPFNLGGEDTRGVFGSDDRQDVTEIYGYDELINATMVMVPKSSVKGNRIYTKNLRDNLISRFGVNRFDDNVKYLNQPTAGSCTGFLIAPDMLVTAGHCIAEVVNNCENYVWIFDYTNKLKMSDDQTYITIDPANVYSCEEILDYTFDEAVWHDYAFIRLDRKSDRMPYRFRVDKSVQYNQDVFTIGSPTGLPLKFANNAKVTSTTSEWFFRCKLDGFPGNSGGPVFDQSGWIEGILVAGSQKSIQNNKSTGDYIYDASCDCIKTVEFSSFGYEGTLVQRINLTNFELLVEAIYDNLVYAVQNKDNVRLDKWMAYIGIVEHPYTIERGRLEFIAAKEGNLYALEKFMTRATSVNVKDELGRNLLNQAIKSGNTELFDLLIKLGVNPNAKDQFGETPLYWALQLKNTAMVKRVLLSGGKAKVNDLFYGQTPLHLAVAIGQHDLVELLVDNGADINAKNERGWTTVKYARKIRQRKIKRYLKRRRKELK